MQQSRESQSALNSKLNNIEQHLAAVDHDLQALALEHQLWQQERLEWQDASNKQIESSHAKMRNELSIIERQIRQRDERCREAIEKIGSRIKTIEDVQRHCGMLVAQINRRVQAVEELLGGQ